MIKKLWNKFKFRNKYQREIWLGNSSKKFIFSKPPTSLELQNLMDWKSSIILEGIVEKHHGLWASMLYKRSR